MITVLFFASLKEVTGRAELQIPLDGISRISDLVAKLVNDQPDWREVLTAENILISVNQSVIQSDLELNAGDEVGFLPPVTGG